MAGDMKCEILDTLLEFPEERGYHLRKHAFSLQIPNVNLYVICQGFFIQHLLQYGYTRHIHTNDTAVLQRCLRRTVVSDLCSSGNLHRSHVIFVQFLQQVTVDIFLLRRIIALRKNLWACIRQCR